MKTPWRSPPPAFNAAASDGQVRITVVATAEVENLCTPAPFVQIAVEYDAFEDCNANQVPDGCEPDCNLNGIPDDCDVAAGRSADTDTNGVPDECQNDCDTNGIPDLIELAAGSAADCNANTIPDRCDIAAGRADDCNANAIPDTCDLAAGTSADCDENDAPDECQLGRQQPAVLFAQSENRSDGLYADAACTGCGDSGRQSLADNFILSARSYVFGVTLWGGYEPAVAEPPEDAFTVNFYRSLSGLPLLSSRITAEVRSSRLETGSSWFADSVEYRYELLFEPPVDLGAGTWFMGALQSHLRPRGVICMGETADAAPTGVPGLVFAWQTPGDEWTRTGSIDLAFEFAYRRTWRLQREQQPRRVRP